MTAGRVGAGIGRSGHQSSTVQELAYIGVGFVSLTEALDMTTATGRAMAGLVGVFAQFEHDLPRERVRAGLAEARLNANV